MAFAHKAASDFTSKSSRSQTHLHLLHIAFHFFRPTLPTPNKATLLIRFANLAKAQTTLHVKLTQKDKICAAGYIMLDGLQLPTRKLFETCC